MNKNTNANTTANVIRNTNTTIAAVCFSDKRDSEDPKPTLSCREIAFATIYALFREEISKGRLELFRKFIRIGGGRHPLEDAQAG